ncbi:hypothetical protein M9H77_13088 [Catharanthus roseus]|uniref:Uncharacterized protein n=1 Tax=Catharanthus roseus TaxID=4058 RepID=A0ACC0BJ67_CATRO|nr:hypothetical protein M9H77_13088 [Catharanthus roseus]
MEYNWSNPSWKMMEAKSKQEDYQSKLARDMHNFHHSDGNGFNAYGGKDHGNGNFTSRRHVGNFEDSSKDEDGKLAYKSIKTINFFPSNSYLSFEIYFKKIKLFTLVFMENGCQFYFLNSLGALLEKKHVLEFNSLCCVIPRIHEYYDNVSNYVSFVLEIKDKGRNVDFPKNSCAFILKHELEDTLFIHLILKEFFDRMVSKEKSISSWNVRNFMFIFSPLILCNTIGEKRYFYSKESELVEAIGKDELVSLLYCKEKLGGLSTLREMCSSQVPHLLLYHGCQSHYYGSDRIYIVDSSRFNLGSLSSPSINHQQRHQLAVLPQMKLHCRRTAFEFPNLIYGGMTWGKHENMENFQGSVTSFQGPLTWSRARKIKVETQRNKFGRV